MKKSLMIVTEAFDIGGVETYIRTEIEELTGQGWAVHLVCGRNYSPVLIPECVASITSGVALGPEAGIGDFLKAIDIIVEVGRAHAVSLIHAHPFTSNIVALASAQELRVPLFLTLHGPSSIVGTYGAIYDFMVGSMVLPSASAVFAVSEEVRNLAKSYVPHDRLQLQRNAVAPVDAGTDIAENGRWLLVSRLDSAKIPGVLEFVEVLLEMPGMAVDICGDGPERSRIEDQFVTAIAGGRLRLLGTSASVQSMMPSYLGVAGMGRVVIEGMVQGLPIVLVGYDGVKGVLDDSLRERAAKSNYSGRGLPSVGPVELRKQLANLARMPMADTERVRELHDPATIWSGFTALAAASAPIGMATMTEFVDQLRAMHGDSAASAYWSREMMDVLIRVVAGGGEESGHLRTPLALLASSYTRGALEQEVGYLRGQVQEMFGHIDSVIRGEQANLLGIVVSQMSSLEERLNCQTHERERALQISLEGQVKDAWELVSGSVRKDIEEDIEALHQEFKQQSLSFSEALQGQGEAMSASLQVFIAKDLAAQHRKHESRMDALSQDIHMQRQKSESMIASIAEEAREGGYAVVSALRGLHSDLSRKIELGDDSRRLEIENLLIGLETRMELTLAKMEERMQSDLRRLEAEIHRGEEFCREVELLCDRIEAMERELDDVYSSTSWVVTRPMRLLKRMVTQPRATLRRMRNGLADESNLAAGRRENPSLLRRSFNFARRTATTGRLDPSDRARLLAMVRTGYSNTVQNLGLPERLSRPVLSPTNSPADVFVWCVIDWHFRMQRPQHLATALAGKGHRVFYISNNFVDSGTPGFTAEALDETGRLFQINLNLKGAPQIYVDLASAEQVAAICVSLSELLKWTCTTRSISLVQHPYWIEPAQCLPNMQLIYDCMDHHGGFENNASSILDGEELLVRQSDLLIVTSQWLMNEMSSRSKSIALIRNATEYERFAYRPARVFADTERRKVIGYYGAIAEWFDVELVRKVAVDHADALVVLVGRDTASAQARLQDLPNVTFVGEVPYAELPYWLYGFDVCLLPFQVIPLTLATNPVKVYEYLSAGKSVVSVDLPEMSQFTGLVELANTPESFSAAVSRALADPKAQVALASARQEFAANQTWAHRAADLDAALMGIQEPRVSVIVLCYNNVEFTRACLDSLERYSDYPNLELIAVDNASSDETPQVLSEWAAAAPNRMHIANSRNLGFSAGNNVGLVAATGDYLVILNNDTYVTPGWVRSLMRHLMRNPKAGLVGPVTNNIGNEARIDIHYASMEEMIERAGEYTRSHPGHSFPIDTAAFFCIMMTRRAYEAVGPMDEDFGVGFFEDDDYCRRLALQGFEVRCADDVFVHHHLSASFDKLKAEVKQELFEKNKKIYEAKWGAWVPHVYRERPPH